MIPSIAEMAIGRDRARFLREPDRKVFVRAYIPGEFDPPEGEPDGMPEIAVIVYRFNQLRIRAPVWVRTMPSDDEATAWDMLWEWAVQNRLPGFEGQRP